MIFKFQNVIKIIIINIKIKGHKKIERLTIE